MTTDNLKAMVEAGLRGHGVVNEFLGDTLISTAILDAINQLNAVLGIYNSSDTLYCKNEIDLEAGKIIDSGGYIIVQPETTHLPDEGIKYQVGQRVILSGTGLAAYNVAGTVRSVTSVLFELDIPYVSDILSLPANSSSKLKDTRIWTVSNALFVSGVQFDYVSEADHGVACFEGDWTSIENGMLDDICDNASENMAYFAFNGKDKLIFAPVVSEYYTTMRVTKWNEQTSLGTSTNLPSTLDAAIRYYAMKTIFELMLDERGTFVKLADHFKNKYDEELLREGLRFAQIGHSKNRLMDTQWSIPRD